jgi:uncharacterized protein YjbI with pentapeptide repeats
MANQEHLDILMQGVEVWNAWRQEHPGIQPDLSDANLSGSYLFQADLRWANLRRADLFNVHMSEVDLYKADLRQADLVAAELSSANLSGANLRGAYLNGAYLCKANLSRANLWEAYLRDANLKNVNLSDAHLNGANLNFTYLQDANLSGAHLNGANLSGAYMSRANLTDANMSFTMLGAVNLSEANLSRANLGGAHIRWTNLSETNLSGVTIGSTQIASVDLRKTKGLAEITHEFPSLIELYTVQFPQDGSAHHFLRGAGVPDEWIDFWQATMMHPTQYYSCFISYSSKDEVLAHHLHADLQASGVRCWFAPEDLQIGNKFRQRIDEAIHLQDKLLLLLSEFSITSAWVEDEVEAALEKEQRQQREVLFPVRLDESVMQTSAAWAAKLRRSRHIGDFTRWKEHDEYQKGLTRLLRDLKQEAIHDTIESDANKD